MNIKQKTEKINSLGSIKNTENPINGQENGIIKERKELNKKPKYPVANKATELRLQSASNKVYAKLSKAERNAMSSYTLDEYEWVNKNSNRGVIDPRIGSINGVLNKFYLDQNITVFRGESMRHYVGLSEGDVYQPSMFFSTSIDKKRAQVFQKLKSTRYQDGALLEIKVPKGTECLYIGRNTDYAENEKELLLSNKLEYKVISIKKTKIILEVIGKNDK